MKNKTRFALTFLLCLCVCLFLIPAAFAENGADTPDIPAEELEFMIAEGFGDTSTFGADLVASGTASMLEWKLYSDGLMTISGEGWMSDYTSTETSDWRAYKDSIKRVWISSGAASIGKNAFYNCANLVEIHIPNSVTSIGRYAFYGCSGLTSVTIPEGVTSIGWYAFYDCSSLTSVTIPEGVTSIGGYAFYNCSSLTNVTIPEGVTSIGYYAFYGCSSLTSVTIPEGVTSIGDGAFSGCSSLTSVTIPEGVTGIVRYAFSDCSSLTSVTIPEGVTSIGDGAFSGCSSLTSVTIPESVTSIGEWAFSGCSSLRDVYYRGTEEQWKSVSIGSFNGFYSAILHYGTKYNCTVTFESNGGTAVASQTFTAGKKAIEPVPPTKENSLFIGWYVDKYYRLPFDFDTPVTMNMTLYAKWIIFAPDFILPAALTGIDKEAFTGGAFSFVKLSDKTASIGSRAFADCPNLMYIYIPAATKTIAANAFAGVTDLTILGASGSYAETYATKHGYTFIAVF